MRDHIRILINGREHEIRGRDTFSTLAAWIRSNLGTGTKIVCEEGDCGACSVLVRRNGGEFVPVNACILSMFQLDGASVVTVEALKSGGALNPVQQAMVDNHGAQCGYCTPGFVVSMTAMFEKRDRVDDAGAKRQLTGNLCRCTGYDPIIKAALAVNASGTPRVRDLFPQTIDDNSSVAIEWEGRHFFAPATIEEALRIRAEHAPVTIVQGGTDVGVWINKRTFSPPAAMSLAKIAGLDELRDDGGTLEVGANVSLARLEDAVRGRIPELHAILEIFGSPQIRNAGTLVGNIANGSPIGDTLPYLFVSGATLEIRNRIEKRLVRVGSFYRGYKAFDLKDDEIITRVRIPVVTSSPSDGRMLRLYKVSRRHDLDISAFTAAVLLHVRGDRIEEAKIAFGGVAPIVMRLPETEAFLTGKPFGLATFVDAGEIARGEVKPISDVRGSAEYRRQLAGNILQKFYYENAADALRVPAEV